MGRSVNYLSHAEKIAYIHTDFEDKYEWEDFQECVAAYIQDICPSLDIVNSRWDDREVQIILENSHVEIGISEYCGLVSVSIRVNENNRRTHEALAYHWIAQVWPKITKELEQRFTLLNKIGSFSNGEGVFESVK